MDIEMSPLSYRNALPIFYFMREESGVKILDASPLVQKIEELQISTDLDRNDEAIVAMLLFGGAFEGVIPVFLSEEESKEGFLPLVPDAMFFAPVRGGTFTRVDALGSDFSLTQERLGDRIQ